MLGNLLDPRTKFVKGSSMKWMNAEDAEYNTSATTHQTIQAEQFNREIVFNKGAFKADPDIAGALIFTRSVVGNIRQ